MRKTETSKNSPLTPYHRWRCGIKCFESRNFTLLPHFPSPSLTHRSPASPDYTNDGQRLRDKPTGTRVETWCKDIMVSFQISRLVFFAFFLFAGVTSGGGIIDVCPKSSSNFTVTFRYDPPYANANDRKWKGLLYDFVQWGLIRCFRQYSCDTKAIHWREISSEDRLSVDILHKKADIVMPITPSLTSSLTEELRNSKITGVTLFTVVKSPGLALVIDYHACKMKTEKLTTNTILSAWPVGAVILLLAGISGISIWALVSTSHSFRLWSLSHLKLYCMWNSAL